jgi:hypothetical protein
LLSYQVRRLTQADITYGAAQRAMARAKLLDALPVIDTYIHNPTKYTFDRIVALFRFAYDYYEPIGWSSEELCLDIFTGSDSLSWYEANKGTIWLRAMELRARIENLRHHLI